MELNLTTPNFSMTNFQNEKTLKQIKGWLVKINDEIQFAMNNLDESNMSEEFKQYIGGIGTAVKEAATATSVQEQIKKSNDATIELVNKTASSIEISYEHAVEEAENRISTTLSEDYAAKSEIGDLDQRLSSQISQTSTAVENRFTEVNNFTGNVNSDLQSFKETLEGYQRFMADGMEIGKSGSPYKTFFSNTRISFLKDNVEIAYIEGTKMYITEIEISQRLSIGNSATGFIEWVPRANGNKSLKWRS